MVASSVRVKREFGGQVHRPERQGSKLVIRGTNFHLRYVLGQGKLKLSQTKKGK